PQVLVLLLAIADTHGEPPGPAVWVERRRRTVATPTAMQSRHERCACSLLRMAAAYGKVRLARAGCQHGATLPLVTHPHWESVREERWPRPSASRHAGLRSPT